MSIFNVKRNYKKLIFFLSDVYAGVTDNFGMANADTLKAYEILLSAKLPAEQAKAILEGVRTAQEAGVDHLISKSEIKEEMANLRTEIYRIKYDLLNWLIPLIIGQGAVVVGLLKVLT